MKISFLPIIFCFLSFSIHAQLKIDIESGLIFSQKNDVRVPNGDQNVGTLFSLDDDFTPDQPAGFLRVEVSYLINERHTIELVAAPLKLEFEDSKLDVIDFGGKTFTGSGTNGLYEFNTYRAGYRYRFVQKPKLIFDVGLSLLVRDARIAISQNDLTADDTDLGFVPLISFNLNYSATEKLSLLLKGDALVGPQGRAEDIFGGILYDIIPDDLELKLGYRFIEGGADVDQVYNFAYIHFADIGLVYTF